MDNNDTHTVTHPTKGTVDLAGVIWTNPGGGTVQHAVVHRDKGDGGVEPLHLLRDSSNQGQGTVLLFDQGEWDAFVAGARDGEFDPDTLNQPPEKAPNATPRYRPCPHCGRSTCDCRRGGA